MNLRVLIPYVLLQGVFLPILWMLDTFYRDGRVVLAWAAFALYELLVVGDAILYWSIFYSRRQR
jgi:hypothetical protein